MAKEAEARLRALTNYYKWFKHKYGDVRYCNVCHSALPKSENAPDFYIAQIGDWVEAKNSDASGTWNCSEIYEGGARKNQREFLTKNGGWLFIELSDSKSIKDKSAYLVPWNDWIYTVEPKLIKEGMKSIRRTTKYNKDDSIRRLGADILLDTYKLEWMPTVGWMIPVGHYYWKVLKEKLLIALDKIDKELYL